MDTMFSLSPMVPFNPYHMDFVSKPNQSTSVVTTLNWKFNQKTKQI